MSNEVMAFFKLSNFETFCATATFSFTLASRHFHAATRENIPEITIILTVINHNNKSI